MRFNLMMDLISASQSFPVYYKFQRNEELNYVNLTAARNLRKSYASYVMYRCEENDFKKN